MKFYQVLAIMIAVVLMCCKGEDDPTDNIFTLTVTNGSGSGKYKSGTSVPIEADAAPEGSVFAGWIGDTDGINKKAFGATSIIMPSKDATIQASFEEVDLGANVVLTADPTKTYQTIDGFGFFGAYNVWWGSSSSMWNDAWGEKVISDLGISIWRNEYFPPATASAGQDADWAKQKPVVEGLKAKADKYGVDLKFIFTVWSPPADLKWTSSFTWAGDENATREPGEVSTKKGGTLNPNKYTEYAEWLKQGIKQYDDVGVNLYALSLQNELLFVQTFNSCTYTVEWYNQMLKAVVPKIHDTYSNVKIFGSENMLDLEGASNNWPYFYHQHLKQDTEAASQVDILAVHGYTDGVAPSSGSGLAERWTNHKEQFSSPMDKPAWMTETSGYLDSWLGSGDKPGALSLAQDIHAGLFYGNMAAWVWWQGSQSDGINEYSLMQGTTVGKKYYVSKHFYRYIRPGAKRIDVEVTDDKVFVTGYIHSENNTQTIVVINANDKAKRISLTGDGLVEDFAMYRTNESTENCTLIRQVKIGANESFVMPANSIVTLQAGGDPL